MTACRNAYRPGNSSSWTCIQSAEGPPTEYRCTYPDNNGYGGETVEAVTLQVKNVTRAYNPPLVCGANPNAGSSIQPLRGVKREPVDMGITLGALEVALTYDSTPLVYDRTDALAAASPAPTSLVDPGVVGPLWTSNLHRALRVEGDGTAILASRGDGRLVSFKGSVATGFVNTDSDHADRLEVYGGGYHYVNAQSASLEHYDSFGRLQSIEWAGGARVTLTYSDSNTPASLAPGVGFLLQAQDDRGRQAGYRYDGAGRLVRVIDNAARESILGYDAQNNLVSIQWPDGRTRRFLYQQAALPQALTGVQDERGVVYASFGYGGNGQAVSTEHAGGVERYSVQYTAAPSVHVYDVYDRAENLVYRHHDMVLPQGTSLQTPGGLQPVAMIGTAIDGKNYLSGQDQPAGSGCAASTSAQTFDPQGGLASRDDFNQVRTCYLNASARHLETARVEGLAPTTVCSTVTSEGAALPAGSRKVSTEWHPDWRLPTRRAEPGRLSYFVYNGQPDPLNSGAQAHCAPDTAILSDQKPIAVLCRQVEQATTDVDGHLGFSASLQPGVATRETRWIYNESGQVLTEDGPRTDVSDLTTYAYYPGTTADHTKGDLQSVTRTVGTATQETQFTKYNAYGQVLESIDPNQVTTTYEYDPRQRLTKITVAGRSTVYTYDPVGQLKRVTQPDGVSFVAFEYDDAHRQTAVSDHLGNRIAYLLDNTGQRTAEQVSDPAGALKRSLTRVMDALSRTQQTTGQP